MNLAGELPSSCYHSRLQWTEHFGLYPRSYVEHYDNKPKVLSYLPVIGNIISIAKLFKRIYADYQYRRTSSEPLRKDMKSFDRGFYFRWGVSSVLSGFIFLLPDLIVTIVRKIQKRQERLTWKNQQPRILG